jgi:hypothetical protein
MPERDDVEVRIQRFAQSADGALLDARAITKRAVPRYHDRRSIAAAAVALVFVAGVGAAAVAVTRGDDPTRITAGPGADAPAPPPAVVVVVRSSRVEFLADPGILPDLDPQLIEDVPVTGVATSPDGSAIFLTRPTETVGCPEIVRVRGGSPEDVIVGGSQTPLVSPDGALLAYSIQCDGVTLGIARLGDTVQHWRGGPYYGELPRSGGPPPSLLHVLGWSADSRRVLYRVDPLDGNAPTYHLVDLGHPPLSTEWTTTDVRVPEAFTAATLAPSNDGATRFIGAVVDPLATLVEFDPQTGAIARTLVKFPMPIRVVEKIVADPSGRHFLALSADNTLWRWSEGDGEPTQVAQDVTDAAWYSPEGT